MDTQLVRRASCAAELAASGALDPVSAVLVTDAAWAALSAGGLEGEDLRRLLPELDLPVPSSGEEVAGEPERRGGRAARRAVAERVTAEARERELAESDLSRVLRTTLEDPEEVQVIREHPLGGAALDALAAAWYRVQLARRFHNDAVTQAQRVRRKVLVRLLRLAGHAPWPTTTEIDDAWPDGLPRLGA